MAEALKLEKAEIRELDASFQTPINEDKWVKVQFNPETLKVSFANQIQQPSNAGDQRGSQARQFVGAGTTKLSLQLWFDVTTLSIPGGSAQDVRELTSRVAYFITPKPNDGSAQGGSGGGEQQPQLIPPAVRFIWGTFQFDGIMDSLEENLEFWSSDGKPLRASVTLALSQQKITFAFNREGGQAGGPGGPRTPGTQPLAQAPSGATLPGLAASAGAGASWQSIAAANGIEDPLRLAPGQLVNLAAAGGR